MKLFACVWMFDGTDTPARPRSYARCYGRARPAPVPAARDAATRTASRKERERAVLRYLARHDLGRAA